MPATVIWKTLLIFFHGAIFPDSFYTYIYILSEL